MYVHSSRTYITYAINTALIIFKSKQKYQSCWLNDFFIENHLSPCYIRYSTPAFRCIEFGSFYDRTLYVLHWTCKRDVNNNEPKGRSAYVTHQSRVVWVQWPVNSVKFSSVQSDFPGFPRPSFRGGANRIILFERFHIRRNSYTRRLVFRISHNIIYTRMYMCQSNYAICNIRRRNSA